MPQFNIRDMPEGSDQQLSDLAQWTGQTKTQVVLIALDRYWLAKKQERDAKMSEQYVIGVEFETYKDRKAATPELEKLFENVTRRETKNQGIHVICSKPIGKTYDEAFEICRKKWYECGWINADSLL